MLKPKVCPVCKTSYADETMKFCPRDGAALRAPIEYYDAFISYRRDGGSHLAQLIRTSLQYARGLNVYVDVNELRSGEFDRELLTKIEAAPNFIVILSPGSLERCRNDGDWLRREIVHALMHGKNVIPVLLKGFVMPPADELPEDMRRLSLMQGVAYDDLFTEESIRRIGDWCRTVGRPTPACGAQVGMQASAEGDRSLSPSLPLPRVTARPSMPPLLPPAPSQGHSVPASPAGLSPVQSDHAIPLTNYLPGAIAVTFLCGGFALSPTSPFFAGWRVTFLCGGFALPFSIAAIVCASRAKTLAAAGDHAQARRAANKARGWITVASVLGVGMWGWILVVALS